ncbi:MAG: ThuA domain-containing protein [Clostridiales bacterium]|jgi:trehalose utilization protein|nr:ThuA domain-containing protein [Clostridiales bacterium]
MDNPRITVWNEYRHEVLDKEIASVYPKGIHGAIKGNLEAHGFTKIRTATLDEPQHGLSGEILESTDVLFWWGHMAHHEVDDTIVAKVHERVLDGMGLVVLHSGHDSKVFSRLLGTKTGRLRWREAQEKERVWIIEPGHPIADGLPEYIEIPHEETYGERFEIPAPDELVMISWFEGGEVFRSGCCWTRGRGRIFYFRPGHESFPTYSTPIIGKLLGNAAKWASPIQSAQHVFGMVSSMEAK